MDNQGPRLELSLVQVVASALAAASGAVAASYLGVAGTVVGTALFSVVATTATAVYTHSLHRTRSRLRAAAATAHRSRPIVDDAPESADGGIGPYDVGPAETAAATTTTVEGLPAVDDWDAADEAAEADRPVRWGRIALASLVVFALVLAAVTVVELTTQRTLADLVRGRNSTDSSPTVKQILRPSSKSSPTPTRTPTPTPTVAPSTLTRTPTATPTAPDTGGSSVTPSTPASPTGLSTAASVTPSDPPSAAAPTPVPTGTAP